MTIEQLPSGAWRISVMVNGVRHRQTINGTLRDARQREAELRVEAKRNPATGTATVAELLERHLTTHQYAPTSLADYRRVHRRLPGWFLDMRVRDVDPATVDRLYAQLTASDWTPFRVRRVHELLGSAWRAARRWGWSSLAPTRDARPPRLPTRDVDPPGTDDMRRLLDHAPIEFRTALRVLAATGMRRGELVGLQWDDIDLDSGAITVRRSVSYTPGEPLHIGDTKTGRKGHRRLVVDAGTLEQLRSLRRGAVSLALSQGGHPGPFVFSLDAGATPWRPDYVTRVFGRLRNQLGLTGVRLHDVRHFVATQMVAAGVDPVTVAGVLGHASPETTLRVYSHFLPAKGGEAIADMTARLDRTAT